MTTTTHTTAGLRALAGVARPRVASGSCPTATPVHATQASLGGFGHQSALWTVDAIAKPATYMVFDGKNRPTRQPSELSP